MKPVLKLSFAIFILYVVKIMIDCYQMRKVLPKLDSAQGELGASKIDKSERLLVQLNRFKNKFKGEMPGRKYRGIIKRQASRIEKSTGKKISRDTLFSEGQIMFEPEKTKTE